MHRRFPIRLQSATVQAAGGMCLLTLCLVAGMGCPAQAQGASQSVQPPSSQVLDRVVAVVNNHAILASDLEDEIRLSVLDPDQGGMPALTRKRALDQLIGRALIQQQIRVEDEQAADPPQAEVDARLNEIRREVPACVRANCVTDAGWKAFLTAHGLTPGRVESYLRYRLEILRFIERRFRQGIQISAAQIEAYYHDTLLPQYAPGEAVPTLDKVSPRIQEILLQQQVNVLFDDWLMNLRKQGDVEVLDPTLEDPAPQSGAAQEKQGSGIREQGTGNRDQASGIASQGPVECMVSHPCDKNKNVARMGHPIPDRKQAWTGRSMLQPAGRPALSLHAPWVGESGLTTQQSEDAARERQGEESL